MQWCIYVHVEYNSWCIGWCRAVHSWVTRWFRYTLISTDSMHAWEPHQSLVLYVLCLYMSSLWMVLVCIYGVHVQLHCITVACNIHCVEYRCICVYMHICSCHCLFSCLCCDEQSRDGHWMGLLLAVCVFLEWTAVQCIQTFGEVVLPNSYTLPYCVHSMTVFLDSILSPLPLPSFPHPLSPLPPPPLLSFISVYIHIYISHADSQQWACN